MAFMADAREERIRAKAHALWEADGKPEGRDQEHWEQAARIIDEEQRQAGRTETDPDGARPDRDPVPANDPTSATLGSIHRR